MTPRTTPVFTRCVLQEDDVAKDRLFVAVTACWMVRAGGNRRHRSRPVPRAAGRPPSCRTLAPRYERLGTILARTAGWRPRLRRISRSGATDANRSNPHEALTSRRSRRLLVPDPQVPRPVNRAARHAPHAIPNHRLPHWPAQARGSPSESTRTEPENIGNRRTAATIPPSWEPSAPAATQADTAAMQAPVAPGGASSLTVDAGESAAAGTAEAHQSAVYTGANE